MPKQDLVLGLDVGTGSAKCVVASVDGRRSWCAAAPYHHARPRIGWAEQDPEDWWRAACDAIQRILRGRHGLRDRIAAVSVCGQGAAAVLVDRSISPVRPAILWLDSRAAAQAQDLNNRHGDRIAALSGKRPAAYNVEPKLLWVMEYEPKTWDRTWNVLTTTGYMTYRFCGRPIMNHSDAGILLGYDLVRRRWSDELSALMGIPRRMYCPLAECDEVVGEITLPAAEQTGLRQGTPVVAGGEDTSAAALAAGVVSSHLGLVSLGTAGTIYISCSRPAIHPRLLSFPHVQRGYTLVGGSMVCGGNGLDWICGLLNEGASADVETICARAAAKPVSDSRLVFLPYLSGELQPINDGLARGVFFGADFSTSADDMVRAVMQGIAFAFAHNLEMTRDLCGAVSGLVAVGRPARNRSFIQTISDATRMPVSVVEERGGACLGAAALAAKGIGLVAAAGDMTGNHLRMLCDIEPNMAAQSRLEALFGIYKDLYVRLRDMFPRLQLEQAPGLVREET